MSEPVVAAIVVSYNARQELLRCLTSLQRVTLPMETVVVDNASSDGSPEAVAAQYPQVQLLRNPENVGFGRANNQALPLTRAPFVLLLNSDAEVREGAVEALVHVLRQHPQVGIAGPRTVEADGAVQVSFGEDLTPWSEWRQRRLVRGVKGRSPAALRRSQVLAARESEPDWVSGACLMARREALLQVGGFDPGFFLYEEDVDLCRRVRQAGWRVLFTPTAEVVHHLGRSVAAAPGMARLEYQRSHLRFYAKHNRPWTVLALRIYLAGRAAAGWLLAMGPDPERGGRRRLQAEMLRIALFDHRK